MLTVIGSSLAHAVGVTHSPSVTSFGVHESPEGSFHVPATGAFGATCSKDNCELGEKGYSDADQAVPLCRGFATVRVF